MGNFLNLWGTFCSPRIEEMPELNALAEKYRNKDVVFLAPTPDGNSASEGFLQKHPFGYNVLPNAFAVVKQYAPHKKSDDPHKKGGFLMLLPTHLVIDQTGIVTYHEWGFSKNTSRNLSVEIERLLNKSK
ncbi:MAG: TlpA disulfide reductase family protein [Pyrinomonadaceae bacterium]